MKVSKCTREKRDHCASGMATINAVAQATTTKLNNSSSKQKKLKQTKKLKQQLTCVV